MTLRPVLDPGAGDWLAAGSGFDDRVRVLHPWVEGPDTHLTERADGYLPADHLLALCGVLASHTSTPDDCFFALWDGYEEIHGGEALAFLTSFSGSPSWPGRMFRPAPPPPLPLPAFAPAVLDGPRLRYGGRDHLLFAGALRQAGRWGAAGYGHGIPRDINSPNLMWPADHAWLVTTDVDKTWTDVVGSSRLIDDLLGAPLLEVVRARHDESETR